MIQLIISKHPNLQGKDDAVLKCKSSHTDYDPKNFLVIQMIVAVWSLEKSSLVHPVIPCLVLQMYPHSHFSSIWFLKSWTPHIFILWKVTSVTPVSFNMLRSNISFNTLFKAIAPLKTPGGSEPLIKTISPVWMVNPTS